MNGTFTKNRLVLSSLEQHHLAVQWIEDALQVRIPSLQLDRHLRDGVYLCKLINRIWPEFKLMPSNSDSIPAWRQNIQQFLCAAEELGLESHQLFREADLMEGTNMDAVISTLLTLWNVSLKKPGLTTETSIPHERSDGTPPVSASIPASNPARSQQEEQPPLDRSIGQSPASSVDSGYAKYQNNATRLCSDHRSAPIPCQPLDKTSINHSAKTSSISSRFGKLGSLSLASRLSTSREKVPFHVRYQEWTDSRKEDGKSHDLSLPIPPIRSASSPGSLYNRYQAIEAIQSQQHIGMQQEEILEPTISSNTNTPMKNTFRKSSLRWKMLETTTVDEPTDDRKYIDLKNPDGSLKTRYKIGDAIGRGHFGTVYRALDLMTGEILAIKSVKVKSMKDKRIDDAELEAELLKTLDHPNIVKYIGLIRTSGSVCIVLEYIENGSLAKTLKTFESFPEYLVAEYCLQILQGLAYLHSQQVVHCDLKAANILTTKQGKVKLSDFGVSLNLHLKGDTSGLVTGTPNWMAPEVITLQGASTKSDIWSLGCTVVELCTGKPPYDGIEPLSVMYRVVQDEYPPLPLSLSAELRDFLHLCFRKDPEERPSARTLLFHPWITRNVTSESGERTATHNTTMTWGNRPTTRAFPATTSYSHVFDSDDEGLSLSAPQQQQHQQCFIDGAGQVAENQRNGTSITDMHMFVDIDVSGTSIHGYCSVCCEDEEQRMLRCEGCDIVCHERCASGVPSCHVRQPNNRHSGLKFISSPKWRPQTRRLSRILSAKFRTRDHDRYI